MRSLTCARAMVGIDEELLRRVELNGLVVQVSPGQLVLTAQPFDPRGVNACTLGGFSHFGEPFAAQPRYVWCGGAAVVSAATLQRDAFWLHRGRIVTLHVRDSFHECGLAVLPAPDEEVPHLFACLSCEAVAERAVQVLHQGHALVRLFVGQGDLAYEPIVRWA